MIMQGDIKRIVDQVNEIVEKLVVRIGVLEDEVVVLKATKEQKPANPEDLELEDDISDLLSKSFDNSIFF